MFAREWDMGAGQASRKRSIAQVVDSWPAKIWAQVARKIRAWTERGVFRRSSRAAVRESARCVAAGASRGWFKARRDQRIGHPEGRVQSALNRALPKRDNDPTTRGVMGVRGRARPSLSCRAQGSADVACSGSCVNDFAGSAPSCDWRRTHRAFTAMTLFSLTWAQNCQQAARSGPYPDSGRGIALGCCRCPKN